MKISLLALGTALALSFASLLNPTVSSAQPAPNDCTSGQGFYSCDFKDEAGGVQSGFLGLFALNNSSLEFFADNGNSTFFGGCNCGLEGNTNDNKPLKDTKDIVCAGFGEGFDSVVSLAGKVSGNPNNPSTLEAKGQLHVFPGGAFPFNATGYLFNCEGVEEPI